MSKPVSGDFSKTAGWLDWFDGPTKPAFTLPAGAVDAHCHVFGPGGVPLCAGAQIHPCDASKAQLFALRDHLGFARNVVVQATCHGADNRAMVDACRASNGKARGVATVKRAVTMKSCKACTMPVCAACASTSSSGWWTSPQGRADGDCQPHRQAGLAYRGVFRSAGPARAVGLLHRLPTTVVVDHMGRPDVSLPVDGPQFELFVKLMREHDNIWSKVSCPERLSVSGPKALDGERHAYHDVIPFARKLVETFPERVLWGTDWPHPNLKDHMPDDGLLVDFIPHIAPTAAAATAAGHQPHAPVLAGRMLRSRHGFGQTV
jgi:2-pyrone-4,6-dicarboxylate lactonase